MLGRSLSDGDRLSDGSTDPSRDPVQVGVGNDGTDEAAHDLVQDAKRRAQEQEEARKQAEDKAQEAETRAQEQEEARKQAEDKAQEAETRAQEQEEAREQAEDKAQEAETRAQLADEKAQEADRARRSLLDIQASARQAQDATKAGISRKIALYDQWQSSSNRAIARKDLWTFASLATALLLGATALALVAGFAHWSWLAPGIVASMCVIGVFVAATVGIPYLHGPPRGLPEGARVCARGASAVRITRRPRFGRTATPQSNADPGVPESVSRSAAELLPIQLGCSIRRSVGLGCRNHPDRAGDGNTSKIAVAGVAGIGSALSGYIASTYLALHRQAGDQLRYFADQPIITSYIYEAERLAQRFEEGAIRNKMYQQLVSDILGVARRAQAEALKLLQRARRKRPRRNAGNPASRHRGTSLRRGVSTVPRVGIVRTCLI